MTNHILILIILISSFSNVFCQTDSICSFKFSKQELKSDSIAFHYKLTDSLNYIAIQERKGIIPKDTLIAKIKTWNKKNSTIMIQRVFLSKEEKLQAKTNTDVILVLWEKRNVNNNREKYIKRAIKNCR